MAGDERTEHRNQGSESHSIARIGASGYKSISHEQSIAVKPLTILAGANSSGKSSIMQPLLLLKQTLEASYDPGALLLNGPNVRFTSADQLLSRGPEGTAKAFRIEIDLTGDLGLAATYARQDDKPLDITEMVLREAGEESAWQPGLTGEQIDSLVRRGSTGRSPFPLGPGVQWSIKRDRCFLAPGLGTSPDMHATLLMPLPDLFGTRIGKILHLPGLRGNPERTYPVTAVGPTFPGTFEKYAASIIAQWQADKQDNKLRGVAQDLSTLGLTWTVTASRIDDTQVEIKVGRLPRGEGGEVPDVVSIADVGLGVSQTLPVVVALHAADPTHLVYLEQPEIHLHPRAQVALADVLAKAIDRGGKVVVETHSSLLLLSIQSLVAQGKIDSHKVKLHWFERTREGITRITSADMDESGALGDWPEDFGRIHLDAERRYLDAVTLHEHGETSSS